MEVGFGALTGRPFAFTGARVPALSAFLCSRWICRKYERVFTITYPGYAGLALSFLEMGIITVGKKGICNEFEYGRCSPTRFVGGKVGSTTRKFGGGVRVGRVST